MKTRNSLMCIVIGIAGCATTPEVQLRYFAPSATTTMTVTQTIDCSNDKARLLISHTPSAVTTYASDLSRSYTLDTTALRSAWANTELTVEWTDDGRLKSVNHTATGQGESIIKAVLAFVASPAVGGGPPSSCDKLVSLTGGKPASIVYEGSIYHSNDPGVQVIKLLPTAASRATFAVLSPGLPQLSFGAGPRAAGVGRVASAMPLDSGAAQLILSATASTPLELKVDALVNWTGNVVVPTAETYVVPIPRPQPFGKQVFALVLSESGAIQKLTYNAETGVTAATNAATGISSFGTNSDQAATAAMKAKADLIAANQRLANCQAKPEDCK